MWNLQYDTNEPIYETEIIPKEGNAKEHSHPHTTVLNSHATKVMLKRLQASLQHYMNQEQYVNREPPNVQAWGHPRWTCLGGNF